MLEELESHARWQDGAYFLTQEFRLRSPALSPKAIAVVERLDALVNERTRAAGCGLLRWHGETLMLGPLCMLKLGALKPRPKPEYEAAAERAILGGLIARRPGGVIWYGVRMQGNDLTVAAGLSGFLPRLPRSVFALTQAPVHRATIRHAVRQLVAGLEAVPD